MFQNSPLYSAESDEQTDTGTGPFGGHSLGHTQRCSGLIPSSVFRITPGYAQGTRWGAGTEPRDSHMPYLPCSHSSSRPFGFPVVLLEMNSRFASVFLVQPGQPQTLCYLGVMWCDHKEKAITSLVQAFYSSACSPRLRQLRWQQNHTTDSLT